MKLIKCYVSSFGNLKNFSYEFSEGLNVIFKENGFGKSTFANFIKSMFYGLSDGKRTVANNERLKFKPWGLNEKFGGYVVFETPKGQFRLERFFGTKASDDEMRLFDNKTGKELVSVPLVGQKLFGIDEEGFLSTLYFSEKDVVVKGNSSLTARYNSTIDLSNDEDTDLAIERVKNCAKEYKYSGERGLIWDSHRKINALEFKISECEKSEQTAVECRGRINALQSELDRLNKDIQQITDSISVAGKLEAVNVKKERISYVENRLRTAKDNFAKSNALLRGKNVTNEQIEICNKTIDDLKLLSSQAINIKVDVDALAKKRLESTPTTNPVISKGLLFGGLSVLIVGAVLAFALSFTALGIALAGLGLICAVCGFLLGYKGPSVSIFDEQIAEKLNAYNQLNSLIVENTNKLNGFFAQFGLQDYEHSEAVKVLQNALDDCNRYGNEVEQLQNQLDALSSDKDLSLNFDLTEDVSVLKRKLSFLNAEYSDKSNKLASYISDLILLEKNMESLSEFENNLYEEREKKANLEDELNVLNLTHKFLTQANENQKLRYREPLSKAFNKYLSYLSDGKTSADIDVDFEVTVDENGSKKQIDYYSKGFNSLFNVCRRFALIDVLYKDNKPFIILDDPFMSLDESKIENSLKLVDNFAKEYQVIYLVCHDSRIIK